MVGVLVSRQADPNRQTLHDFHVIAGRVFWRKETVLLAARSGESFDVAAVVAAGRIDVNRYRLASPDLAQLRFLEVSGDPDIVERNDREQLLSRLHALSNLDSFLSNHSAACSEDLRIFET